MVTFVVVWAVLDLQPPALQLRDSHFVQRCFLCPSLSLCPVVPLLVFIRNVLLGMERGSFFFQVFLRILQSVVCSFLNSVIFMACDSSSPLQEIGRAVGVALMKQCGWRADLRDPDLEVELLVCQWAWWCFQHCL